MPGISVNRRYEILDERARIYFFLLERMPEIVDIRESWPILDIDGTVKLSLRFAANHPKHDIFPEPVCLDFIITEASPEGLKDRAVSLATNVPSMSAEKKRLKQVEQQWCKDHKIDWALVDTSKLDRTIFSSLRFMRGWHRHRFVPDHDVADAFATLFMNFYQTNIVLKDLVELVRKNLRMESDAALDLFRYCAWSRRIPVSLRGRLAMNCPVSLKEVENA